MAPGRAAAPPGEDGADDDDNHMAEQAERQCSNRYDVGGADEWSSRVLRSIGREVGVWHLSDGVAELVDEWLGGAA